MTSRIGLVALAAVLMGAAAPEGLAERFMALDRTSTWQQIQAVPLKFKTGHPQGLVKVGPDFFMSTVDLQERPVRFSSPQGRYDRTTGRGVGRLVKFDAEGNRLGEMTLGEGAAYHPGGIDFDGRWIWVPVAEYRPNSASVVYRVDPQTLKGEPVLRFSDHLGAVVHDKRDKSLHAVSWGSRYFYRWDMDASGKPTGAPERVANGSHYVDYQDCHALPDGRMLCGGLTQYDVPGAGKVGLGGLELVSLRTYRPLHQLPVTLCVTPDIPMTHNPFWAETLGRGLRFYFVPEDDTSHLFVYEVGG